MLFGGQGPDLARLGPELARAVSRIGSLLELAADLVELEPAELWARGGRALERTEVYQPVLVAIELGVHDALTSGGVRPYVLAGHSLGELSAWAAAGGLRAEDAVEIAAVRGRLMAERGSQHPGGLLALEGPDEGTLEHASAIGRQHGGIYVAAVNAAAEWVIGGSDEALRAVARLFPSKRLAVEGPWHGPPMEPVLESFCRLLSRYEFRPLQTRLVSSGSGQLATGSEMPSRVAEQLTHPVQWADALATLVELDVTDLVTVGPGRIMRGLAYRNDLRHVRMHSTDTPEMIDRSIEVLTA